MRSYAKSLGLGAALLSVALAAAPTVVRAATTKWHAVASMPKSRYSMAATEGLNGNGYFLGGKQIGKLPNVTDVYNPTTGKWSTLPAAPGIGANAAAVTGPAGKVYAIGSGVVDGSDCWDTSATVDALSTTTGTWVGQTPLPDARGGVAAVSGPGGLIYALRGATADCGQADSTNEVDLFNPNIDSWSSGVPMLTPRYSFGAVVGADGRIYAIGGIDNNSPISSVEAFSPTTGTWSSVAPLPIADWINGAVSGKDGNIYVMDYNVLAVYDIATNTWTELPAPPGVGLNGIDPLVSVGSSHSLLTIESAGTYKAAPAYIRGT